MGVETGDVASFADNNGAVNLTAREDSAMSASLEYTEWHLEVTGWVRGTTKTDSAYVPKERPTDAIATFVYSEEISYFGPADERVAKKWTRQGADGEVTRAIAAHGDCPRSL